MAYGGWFRRWRVCSANSFYNTPVPKLKVISPDSKEIVSSGSQSLWLHRVIGFVFGLVSAYALSYFTALWGTSMIIVDLTVSRLPLVATLACTAVVAALIAGIVQSRLRIRGGFIAAIAAFFFLGIIAGALTELPIGWGNTAPWNVEYVLANVGINAATIGIFVAVLIQAGVTKLQKRRIL